MSQTRDSINSIIITVVFLVLTAIATVLYGGSAEQKTAMNNNWLWRQTRTAFDAGLSFLVGVGNLGNKNSSSTPAEVDQTAAAAAEPGFWSRISTNLQDAWQKSETASTSDQSLASPQPLESGGSSFAWQKNAQGAEIIFTAKSGREYKLPLPFKFLSQ
jgi:hypothetical protein